MTAVALVPTQAPPRSVLTSMSERYGMEPAAFEATVRATVCKGSVSREEFAAFLLVAKEHRLNPLTKEIYAFPAKGGGIQPIVSIDGWARIINEHPAFDGVAFRDEIEDGQVIAITCEMFRKDRAHPVSATEYMAECRRATDVWKTWPRRMLRHKAMIQAARYAFGFSGIVDPDEFERITEARIVPAPTGLKDRLEAARAAGRAQEGFSTHHGAEAATDDPGADLDVVLDGDAIPDHDATTGEVIDAEVEDIPAEEATAGAPAESGAFTVFMWADRLADDLPLYETVEDVRAAWDLRKDELKAAAPERFKALNMAVVRRAEALGKEAAQ